MRTIAVVFLTWVLLSCGGAPSTEEVPGFEALSGPYFGLEPPGDEPAIFLPGLVSTTDLEGCVGFLDEGRVFVFSGWERGTWFTFEKDGRWTRPEKAPWQNERNVTDFTVGPDGRTIYFQTSRLTGPHDDRRESNTWTVEWTGSGWTEPRVLPGEANSPDTHEGYPSVASSGLLVFFGRLGNPFRVGEIYVSRSDGDDWRAPEPLPDPVNSDYHEVDPLLAPDGSYILFGSGRPGVHGLSSLYASFRNDDGTWSHPVSAGAHLVPAVIPIRMSVTPDGRFLFYVAEHETDADRGAVIDSPAVDRYGDTDVYWVGTGFIEELREATLGTKCAAEEIIREYEHAGTASAMARLRQLVSGGSDGYHVEPSELLVYGGDLIAEGMLDEAEAWFLALGENLRDRSGVDVGYANALILNGQTVVGLEVLRDVWRRDPAQRSESLMGLLTFELRAKSRHEDELAVLRFVVEKFPESEWAHSNLEAAMDQGPGE